MQDIYLRRRIELLYDALVPFIPTEKTDSPQAWQQAAAAKVLPSLFYLGLHATHQLMCNASSGMLALAHAVKAPDVRWCGHLPQNAWCEVEQIWVHSQFGDAAC